MAANYGYDDAIVKVALTPKVFEQVVIEMHTNKRFAYRTGEHVVQANLPVHKMGELQIFDIQLLARERDNF